MRLAGDGDNLLIPASPAPAPLVANESYDETAFTNALRPPAELRRDSDAMSE